MYTVAEWNEKFKCKFRVMTEKACEFAGMLESKKGKIEKSSELFRKPTPQPISRSRHFLQTPQSRRQGNSRECSKYRTSSGVRYLFCAHLICILYN